MGNWSKIFLLFWVVYFGAITSGVDNWMGGSIDLTILENENPLGEENNDLKDPLETSESETESSKSFDEKFLADDPFHRESAAFFVHYGSAGSFLPEEIGRRNSTPPPEVA